jgi:hypothetical protein
LGPAAENASFGVQGAQATLALQRFPLVFESPHYNSISPAVRQPSKHTRGALVKRGGATETGAARSSGQSRGDALICRGDLAAFSGGETKGFDLTRSRRPCAAATSGEQVANVAHLRLATCPQRARLWIAVGGDRRAAALDDGQPSAQ